MALLMVLFLGYTLLIVLPPAGVGAWGLGAGRSRVVRYGLPLFLVAYGLSFFLYKYGMSWSLGTARQEWGDLLSRKGGSILVLSCVSWLTLLAGRMAIRRWHGPSAPGIRFVRTTFIVWVGLALLMPALSRHWSFGPSAFYVPSPGGAHASSFIAHAGGSIDGYRYTNSREAVERSLQTGFRFVEIDLQKTSDGIYVGAHDWEHFASISGVEGIPDLEEFLKRTIHGRYGVLTSGDLRALLERDKEIWLVTDKAKDYPALLSQIPFPDRMIVEVFSHRGWREARAAGVVRPALNVETMNMMNMWKIGKMAFLGVDIITVDVRELAAHRGLFEWLHEHGLTILAYTVDDEEQFRSLYGHCLDMAYIDYPFPSFFEEKTDDAPF